MTTNTRRPGAAAQSLRATDVEDRWEEKRSVRPTAVAERDSNEWESHTLAFGREPGGGLRSLSARAPAASRVRSTITPEAPRAAPDSPAPAERVEVFPVQIAVKIDMSPDARMEMESESSPEFVFRRSSLVLPPAPQRVPRVSGVQTQKPRAALKVAKRPSAFDRVVRASGVVLLLATALSLRDDVAPSLSWSDGIAACLASMVVGALFAASALRSK